MFCGKCGTENAEGAKFCKACGAKLEKINLDNTVRIVPCENAQKNKKIGIIVSIAALAAVICIVIALFGGRSYKSIIKKYMAASLKADGKTIVNLIPDKMLDYAMEESGYDHEEFESLVDDIDEQLQEAVNSIDDYLGADWKASYEIIEDEEIKGDDLDDIKSEYEVADLKISAARKIEIEITVKGAEEEKKVSMSVPLIKCGNSWYLDAMSAGELF